MGMIGDIAHNGAEMSVVADNEPSATAGPNGAGHLLPDRVRRRLFQPPHLQLQVGPPTGYQHVHVQGGNRCRSQPDARGTRLGDDSIKDDATERRRDHHPTGTEAFSMPAQTRMLVGLRRIPIVA